MALSLSSVHLQGMDFFLARLIEPVGLVWIFSWVGLIVALRKRQMHSACVFGMLTLFVWLAGSRLSSHLLASLERPYANVPLESVPPCDAVVMLGGVLGPSEQSVFGLDFGEAADRAVAALELIRRGKAKVLVLGGAGGQMRPSGVWQESSLLQGWARAWGLAQTNMIPLRVCANTSEEAMQVRELVQQHQWRRILLVTSAYHMKRAEGLFRRNGISTVAVGTDFTALSELSRKRGYDLVPELKRFHHLGLYLHERVGWLYYWLRDRVE